MNGFPKHLNTREDYENCHLLALAGEMDRVKMKAAWQRLIDAAKVWVFKAAVTAAYQPLQDEKVMKETKEGVEVYTCFELVSDPKAEIVQLAYTTATVNSKIAELEVI